MKVESDTHLDCPVTKTLKIIGSKWTMLLIHNLLSGTKRFGELQRLLPGISPKTLSQRLQELEQEQIVMKKVYTEIPPRVEYSLTEKGRSLKGVFKALNAWGQQA